MRHRTSFAVMLLFAVMLIPASAAASGFSLTFYGGLHGHPNTDGGLNLYWNPARLSVENGTYLTIDNSLVWRRATYDRVLTTENAFDANGNGEYDEDYDDAYFELNSGEGTLNSASVLPYLALGTTQPIGSVQLGFSAGVIPAFGGGSDWDNNEGAPAEYPGALYGPQRWSAIKSSLLVLHYTFGASITLPDNGISFGATIAYADAELHTTRSRNLNRGDQLVDGSGNLQEGRIYFNGEDNAFALSFAASYTNGNVTASAVYRPAYRLEMVGPLRQVYATSDPTEVEAYLEFKIPHIFQTAIGARFGRLELTGITDFTTWSNLNNPTDTYEGRDECPGNDTLVNSTRERLLCIPRNYQNTLSVRGLAEWHFSDSLALAGTVGIDPSSIPLNAMSPDLPDAFKWRIGIGVQWALNDNFGLMGSYQHDFVETRNVPVGRSIQEPHADGEHAEARDYFNLSLEGRF